MNSLLYHFILYAQLIYPSAVILYSKTDSILRICSFHRDSDMTLSRFSKTLPLIGKFNPMIKSIANMEGNRNILT